MAVNIPATAILQPSDTLDKTGDGTVGFSMSWKGPYADLKSCALAIHEGDLYDGMTVASANAYKGSGDWGTLVVKFGETSSSSGGGGGLAPISDKWSIKGVRNDVSILAYCGKTNDNPNRAWIECWLKENDAAVAKIGDYTKPDGTVAHLVDQLHHTATYDLIHKYEQGIESVMRFYPIVTRRRVYSTVPPECLQKLGFIDTPPAPGINAKSPSGLAAVISDYQWLKCQDDSEQADKNQWSRTESWMGIKKAHKDDSPWDPDLYGDNRWPMPYTVSGNNSGGKTTT